MSGKNNIKPPIGKRILKWLLVLFAVIILILFLVCLYFNLKTSNRESFSPHEKAPSSGHFISVDGTELFYQEAGPSSGKTVLLLHGTGAWSEIWKGTMNVLAEKGFHAIAVDIPPFGFSGKPSGSDQYSADKQAARIIKMLDALHLEHIILLGHSVGARPTLEIALADPKRIDSIILVDPALGFASDTINTHFEQNNPSLIMKGFFGFRFLRNSGMAAFGTNPSSTKKLFESFVWKKESVSDEKVTMLQQPLSIKGITKGYGDWMDYLLCSRQNSLISNFENYKKIKVPVLLVWGEKDEITPLWQGRALLNYFPKSSLCVLKNSGHIPYVEEPGEFYKVITTFLKP